VVNHFTALEQLVDEGADVTVGSTFDCPATRHKLERKLMKLRYPLSVIGYPQRRQHASVLVKRIYRVAFWMRVKTYRDHAYLL